MSVIMKTPPSLNQPHRRGRGEHGPHALPRARCCDADHVRAVVSAAVDLLQDADPRAHDAHGALEGQGVLDGFGVDGAEAGELAGLVIVGEVGHACHVGAVLLAVVGLIEDAPAAVGDGVKGFGVDAHLGRVDLQAVVELDGAVWGWALGCEMLMMKKL